jgi:hypothetical protein
LKLIPLVLGFPLPSIHKEIYAKRMRIVDCHQCARVTQNDRGQFPFAFPDTDTLRSILQADGITRREMYGEFAVNIKTLFR